jgi:hypothetical protein
VFSVSGARVTLDDRNGWQCACAGGRSAVPCDHIEQAQILRGRRGEKRPDDTIELELSPEQLLALSEALPLEPPAPPVSLAARQAKPGAHRWDWTSLLAAAAIAGLSSGITYLAVRQSEPPGAFEQLPAEPPAALALQPETPLEAAVRFVNPFDATEVFEFPSGTSENSARDAVAEVLLKRAQERIMAADALRERFHEQHKPVVRIAQGN